MVSSIVDKYYRRIINNIDNVRIKFDISSLLIKYKKHDSKIDTNKNNISSNLSKINTIEQDNSKYSIQNFFIYNIEIEKNYTLNSDNRKFIIFDYNLVDNFIKDSILEVNTRLLYDYAGYNNIGKLVHHYKLYNSDNILFFEFKSLKTNSGDNLKDDLSQIDLFFVKLNKDYNQIKIELILAMKDDISGPVSCKLYNKFNSNFLCVKYIKKN